MIKENISERKIHNVEYMNSLLLRFEQLLIHFLVRMLNFVAWNAIIQRE